MRDNDAFEIDSVRDGGNCETKWTIDSAKKKKEISTVAISGLLDKYVRRSISPGTRNLFPVGVLYARIIAIAMYVRIMTPFGYFCLEEC